MSRKSKQVQENYSKTPTVDIHQLSENARENSLVTDLLRSNQQVQALSETIDKMLVTIEQKNNEIMELKQQLLNSPGIIGEASPLITTDEEIIANLQLDTLKKHALARELTLDEIKKYDLLVKNKRLAQGNATTINGDKLDKNMSPAQLMRIAAKHTRTDIKGDE